jgi:hypothetical protein
MIRGLIVLSLLMLGGCQTTRFVTVPCVSKDQKLPDEPERVGGKLTGQAQRDFQIVAGNNARLRAWGQGLNQILEGCRG